ncbi:hypothetical protein RI367_006168 [Sorochytrium milnesiophthora]
MTSPSTAAATEGRRLAASDHVKHWTLQYLEQLLNDSARADDAAGHRQLVTALLANAHLPNTLFSWMYERWSTIVPETSFNAFVAHIAQTFAASDVARQQVLKVACKMEDGRWPKYQAQPQTIPRRAAARLLVDRLGYMDDAAATLGQWADQVDDTLVAMEVLAWTIIHQPASAWMSDVASVLLGRRPMLFDLPAPLLWQLSDCCPAIWEAYLAHLLESGSSGIPALMDHSEQLQYRTRQALSALQGAR